MLIGRAGERARLAAALDAAAGGRTTVLLLVGEPGIGKSALLGDALERARGGGLTTARVAAVEIEHGMPGAAMSLLAAAMPEATGSLPAAWRQAFDESAAGVVDDRSPAALLHLLSAWSTAEPALLVVDDVQWWDRPSRVALAFALRRLADVPVAVLLAGRTQCRDDPVLAGFEQLEVGPLAEDDAAALVRAVAPPATDEVAVSLAGALAGNPLALVETARALADDVAAGRRPLPDPLPVGSAVADRWGRDASSLPDDSRRALLVLAVDETGSAGVVAAGLAVAGLDVDALGPAEEAGLVVLGPDGPAFRHPLVRAAVKQSSAPAERRAAHAALAAALAGGPRLAARAQHLAAASAGPEEALAEQLEADAEALARAGGGHAAAAVAEQSARLTEAPAPKARRWCRAAELTLDSGDEVGAEALADEALALGAAGDVRGRALRVKGISLGLTRDIRAGRSLLHEAIGLVHGRTRDRAVLDALALEGFADDPGGAFSLLSLSPSAEEDPVLMLHRADALCQTGRRREGVPLLREVLARYDPLAAGTTSADEEAWLNACMNLGLPEVHEALARVATAKLATGIPARAYLGVFINWFLDASAGRWDDALAWIDEARRLMEALGRVDYYSDAQAFQLACYRGEGDQVAELRSRTAVVLAATGNDYWQRGMSGQLGLYTLGQGDLAAAVPLLAESVSPRSTALQAHSWSAEHVVCLVESLMALDRTEEARTLQARIVEGLQDAPGSLARAWVERSAAAVAGTATEAETHYLAAISALGGEVHAFALAHTRLLYGQWLRRRRRRADAAGPLQEAFVGFDSLRCPQWAATCRAELAAAGVEVALHDRYDPAAGLTSQERRVAQTVAQGFSNLEAAHRLFLSPKTVEVHLTHVYRKLGISGRAELAGALRESAPAVAGRT